jgi:hypothetical protein
MEIHWSNHLSFYVSIHLSIHLSINLSIHLSIHIYQFISINSYLSIHLSCIKLYDVNAKFNLDAHTVQGCWYGPLHILEGKVPQRTCGFQTSKTSALPTSKSCMFVYIYMYRYLYIYITWLCLSINIVDTNHEPANYCTVLTHADDCWWFSSSVWIFEANQHQIQRAFQVL